MSVSEIKEQAKSNVQKIKNASAPNLLRVAKDHSTTASLEEKSGDLKSALGAYIMASSLIQAIYDSPEYKSESKDAAKRTSFYRDFKDFSGHFVENAVPRAQKLEMRLREVEQEHNEDRSGSVSERPSIADRIQALQGQGLSLAAKPKRLPGNVPSPQSHSSSLPPRSPSSLPSAIHSLNAYQPPQIPCSPPLLPSIDELDEQISFPTVPIEVPRVTLPNVPLSKPGEGLSPPPSSARDLRSFVNNDWSPQNTGASASSITTPIFPTKLSTIDRNLPHNRPSSTPIPPLANGISHLDSPPERSPITSPRRELPSPPSGSTFSHPNHNYSTKTPFKPAPPGGSKYKIDLPVTSVIYPKLLKDYSFAGRKILLLDIRTRAEFDTERIKGDEIVCLEPSILTRDKITSAAIESALVVAPSSERALFSNRAKFELVVMYDASSPQFTPAMSNLARAISETDFNQSLKRPPMLLVGGLEAWKRDIGEEYIHRFPQRDGGPEANNNMLINPHSNNSYIPTTHANTPPSGNIVFLDGRERWVPHQYQHTVLEQPPATQTLQMVPPSEPQSPDTRLVRRPAFLRPHISSLSQGAITFPRVPSPPPMSMGFSLPIQYPSAVVNGYRSATDGYVSPPPVASINPSPVSRRRNDHVDQSHQGYPSLTRSPIDYPDLSTKPVLRPPPAAAPPNLDRRDHRSRSIQYASYPYLVPAPTPPTIQSDYPVSYWTDVQIGVSGLKNMGNTCYMNSTIQCLSATVPFARFFTEGLWKNAVNMLNPLSSKGDMAKAFAAILHELWHGDLPYLVPFSFRKSICIHAPQFGGTDQHDSQEFLSFLLDGLHEDLNRVLQRPFIESTPDREAELETLPAQIASEQEWKIYRMRNDSIVVDYFQGQFRNKLQCLACSKTSTTYNPFMYLTLPLPNGRSTKTTLYQCLDAFVKEEILEKSDAWNCPRCKTLRKATKQLTISRLPPVLLIHLKRFSFKGPFTDKLETLVDFPLKDLDLTNYVPMPLAPSADNPRPFPATPSDDPRAPLPPYKYDLYAVTNHYGNLTSGHYTAFIASRGGWLYCDDSRITNADNRDIVGRPAYILYYKRTR